MTGKNIPRTIAAGLLVLGIWTSSAVAGNPVGTWLRDTGTSMIEIYRCGGAYCGKIVWLQEPNDANGNPRTDSENPDPSKRSQSLIGLQVIINMVESGENKWEGQVYKSDEGRVFNGKMEMRDENTIALAGCVLGGIICRSGDLIRQ